MTSARRIRDLVRGSVDLLLPPRCPGCAALDSRGPRLCDACVDAVAWLPVEGCVLCQQEPAEPRADADSLAHFPRCAACRREASVLDACVAATGYASPALEWIQRFKYPAAGIRGLDPAPAAAVCMLAAEAARAAPGRDPDAVVPVPLHARRLRERAFNPALVLARVVARTRGGRVRARALERIRDTRSQTGLDRRARRRNVEGAFRPREPAPAVVWLVDDVVTTASTLAACATALRRAGAREVVAICAARSLANR